VKATKSWVSQVVWISRRARLGGAVHVAIRRKVGRVDDLYIVRGIDVERLRDDGLQGAPFAEAWTGGPAKWAWGMIELELGCTTNAGGMSA
jgi:hypothetical protein